jgi:predicted metal-dependent phosphoesterase TrpH
VNQQRWKVDMHSHTRLSKDSLNDPRLLIETAAAHGLQALCVTDHNGLANALALSRLPDLPIMVVPSEEVKTSEGEIIGWFLQELIPKGLTPEETVRRIKEQGGIVGVPHPFDRARNSSRLQTPALERLVAAGLVDAIEVFNARTTLPAHNAEALEFARAHGLAMSAGSDAHTLWEVGRAYVEMPPFRTPAEFLASLRQGRVGGALSPALVHVSSRWAVIAKKLRLADSRAMTEDR